MIQNKSWVRRALGLCKLARQRHRSVQAASQTAGGPTQTPSHDTAEQIGYRGKPIMCTCDSWSLAARLLSLWASWCANRRMVRALCGCGRPPAFPRRLLERLLRAWAWVSLSFLWILFTVSLSSDRKNLPAGPLSTENPAPPFTRKLTSSSLPEDPCVAARSEDSRGAVAWKRERVIPRKPSLIINCFLVIHNSWSHPRFMIFLLPSKEFTSLSDYDIMLSSLEIVIHKRHIQQY